MHVSILTYGSRGDVQPFIALSVGLRRAGHTVTLAAPAPFAPLAAAHSLAFAPLPGDVVAFSRALAERAGRNPFAQARVMGAHTCAIAVEVLGCLRAAVQGADCIVHTFVTTSAGHLLAAELGVPDVSVQLFPFFAPYATFPNVTVPAPSLGLTLNQLTHHLATQLFAQSSRLLYAWLRRRHPAIGPTRLPWPALGVRTPLLLAYSPLVVGPTPAGLPLAHTTGFWALDAPADYQPPPALAAFLAVGPPPVSVGFGSMVPHDAPRMAATILAALRRTGQRVVFQRGWAGLGDGARGNDVLAIDEAPHAWLFPRMAAVIHHGGAGTTAAALRAGVPSLTVPFTADQPFWGRRAHCLGVGPPPIPAHALTAAALAAVLPLLADPTTRRRAAAVGTALRAEDGVGVAVRAIEAS